jgi:hydroxymethylbilane synthase
LTEQVALTFGTRGSALARWQTDWVIGRLRAAWPHLNCRIRLFTTSGDRVTEKPLPEFGGRGVFTEELENALRTGEIDVAVHSLKDLPIEDMPGLALGAIGERADARDVLISRGHQTLAALPHGARVGTCSLRRSAQALALRPDLTLAPLRGNVDTRVRKALNGDYDAIVLAAAGVTRLGLAEHIAEYFPYETMLPAPGQGALVVQCRADEAATLQLLAPIDHPDTRAAVTAERAFLKALGGGCSAPVAAYAFLPSAVGAFHERGGGAIVMNGLVASPDGRRLIRVAGQGADPVALADKLAQQAFVQGAGALLQ